ncbi:putative ribonuclease H-like domain-containing protein [Tanacetum coccineum]
MPSNLLILCCIRYSSSKYKSDETISSVPRIESIASKSSKDSLEQHKDVSPSAPIIAEWESDSDDFSNKSGQVTINTAKQTSKAAASIVLTARTWLNIAAPKSKLNRALPKTYSYFKAHSPKILVLLKEKGNAVKFLSMLIWRLIRKVIDHISNDGGSYMPKRFDYVDPQGRLKFSWVFFLANKDETSGILKTFITGIENQINHKVKIIRYNNGAEFKNNDMNQFCGMKGIKRELSVARTPQQNGVAERKNRTLIEAARTMLADSLLPTTFWAEVVNNACYV